MSDTQAAVKKPYDLASRRPQKEAECEFEVDGVGQGVFFRLLGPSHPKRLEFDMELERRKNDKAWKDPRRAIQHRILTPPELQMANNIDRLVACTTGWRTGDEEGVIYLDGEKIQFSEASAYRVYEDADWLEIRDFYHAKLNEAEVFIKSSSAK